MSDTPRTDENCLDFDEHSGHVPCETYGDVVFASFARELERELESEKIAHNYIMEVYAKEKAELVSENTQLKAELLEKCRILDKAIHIGDCLLRGTYSVNFSLVKDATRLDIGKTQDDWAAFKLAE